MKLPNNIIKGILDEFNEDTDFKKTLNNGIFDISQFWVDLGMIFSFNQQYRIESEVTVRLIKTEKEILESIFELLKQKIAIFLNNLEVSEHEVTDEEIDKVIKEKGL